MAEKNKRGLFITFEGGEGTGKTSVINMLEKELVTAGFAAMKTCEPGATKLGEKIRHLLLSLDAEANISAKAELMLFLADRVQHLDEVILPALKEGRVVLCDRHNDSSVAYQGFARGLGMKEVRELCNLACDNLQPDLTLFLDVDPEVGLMRSKRTIKKEAGEGQSDRIESEKLTFHEKVREAMQVIASEEKERVVTIDASAPLSDVYAQALAAVKARL